MDRLAIYKASAGSGKTFRLTGEYLKLIFNLEQSFYTVLAVTFTNKATAEMRDRILKELYKLATGKESNHAKDLKNLYQLSDVDLKNRAKYLLSKILHNYSRFNISTIDSFFQKILKAFTYETGLSSGFNIELNLKAILEISIELFFENINNKKELKEWLSKYAIQKIEDGKSWDIEKDIFEFSLDAFNEVFFSFSEDQLKEFTNIEYFKTYKSQISSVISGFIKQMQQYGQQANKIMSQHGLEVGDFTNGATGVAGYLNKLSTTNQFTIKEPGIRVIKALNSSDNIEGWATKTSKKQTEIQHCVNSGLGKTLADTINYFNSNYQTFNTAKAISRGIDVFAVIIEVYNQMNSYCRDKNIFLLPLASPLLSKMIGNDDAPFIYEKTGEFLKYFMIDEFQDTSEIQWNNFSPLFLNGISQGYKSLVVGDVKQSIYRWRNGDWTLLNHKLANRFKSFGVKEEQLEFNWRSTPEIVNFNNWTFDTIAQNAPSYLLNNQEPNEVTESYLELISNIYASASQQIPEQNKQKHGQISVAFFEEGKDKDENNLWYLEKMVEALHELIDKGVESRDIAIIVRTGKQGSLVAKHLMEYIQKHPEKKEQFSFVSNDSVLLGSSTIVLLLIALLDFLLNHENKECRASIVFFYYLLSIPSSQAALKLSEADINDIDAFLNQLPSNFSENYKSLSQLAFPTIVNQLLNIFIYNIEPEKIEKQLPFIQTFQDIVLNFTQNNGSDISGFLGWWKEFGINTPIGLSEDQNAIRIVTIHKSKGLEYKAVILPFANWGLDQLSKFIWCKTPDEFNHFSLVPVKYSASLASTAFKNEYWTEKTMALMDNLNLLYVAFTRAIESLHVFAPKPSNENEPKKISDLLYGMFVNNDKNIGIWDNKNLTFKMGQIIQQPLFECKKTKSNIFFKPSLKTQNINVRLSSNQFFKYEDNKLVKKLNTGSVYHKIMEQIICTTDINKAIKTVYNQGLISKHEAMEFTTSLKKAMKNNLATTWFNNSYKVLNETNIILSDGSTKRPDRVLYNLNETIVIDYKFTKSKSENHISQVKEYISYMNKIETNKTIGYVWYILDNEIIIIE